MRLESAGMRTGGPMALGLVLFAVAACGDTSARRDAAPPPETGEAAMAAEARPDTTGAALWAHLQRANYRVTWQTWPGKGALYKGQEPHGMLLTTYLNPTAYEALMRRAGQFPPGSIVVKENYMPDSTLAAVTTMFKVQGYNPTANDWFWVKQDPNGVVDGEGMAQGRVPMCIGCHAQRAGNDYVFTGSLK